MCLIVCDFLEGCGSTGQSRVVVQVLELELSGILFCMCECPMQKLL